MDSIRSNWFAKVVDSVDTNTTEFDVLAILGQVDWLQLVQEVRGVCTD